MGLIRVVVGPSVTAVYTLTGLGQGLIYYVHTLLSVTLMIYSGLT